MLKLKALFIFLSVARNFLLARPFGRIIYDVAARYDEINVGDLRKLEKITIKIKRIKNDIAFLKNCQTFQVFPKFVTFRLPLTTEYDTRAIRKRLLRSAIHRRIMEKKKMESKLNELINKTKNILNRMDWMIVNRSIQKNVKKEDAKHVANHEKKLQNLTRNKVLPLTAEEVITNLSNYTLTDEEKSLLKNGLKFSLPPAKLLRSDVVTAFEMMNTYLTSELKEGVDKNTVKVDLAYLANCYTSSYKPSHASMKKHSILKKLKNNKDIVITRPDKGNGVVIMNRSDYHQQIMGIINDTTKFAKRSRLCGKDQSKDITVFREEQLQRFLYSLKKKKLIDENVYEKIRPTGSRPARIYGLPKVHKLKGNVPNEIPPVRPIIDSIGTFNYNLAKYLKDLLAPNIPSDHCATDSFSFVREIKDLNYNEKYMVSFDVTSLFTNIPLHETIDIAVDILFNNNSNIEMSKIQMKKLFLFATAQTHFLYNGEYYDQIDGVAMGSPLGPVLANIFMGHHEKIWLGQYSGPGLLFYRRYVDDIFCLFENQEQVHGFLDYINNQHPNIKFTCEEEENNTLPFLDISISKTEGPNFDTTTYRKSTYTGLLTNFISFTSIHYKVGLIKTLIDRARKINSSVESLKKDLSGIKKTLLKNRFPLHVLQRYFDRAQTIIEPNSTERQNSENDDCRYFKLPYIGKMSVQTKMKLRELVEKYCKPEAKIKIIFTTQRIGSYFGLKDSFPKEMLCNAVYKFKCASCNACYIGETTKRYIDRAREHLHTDKSSAVYKHLRESNDCHASNDENSFSLLDTARTQYQLKIKEALYIEKLKPELNKLVKFINVELKL